jgi:hypothetical protein
MIGRADIEGSKSDVAMNAWPPQASYPCGNFSDTSRLKFPATKGSLGHAFTVCIHTENQNQGGFSPYGQLEISVLDEPPLGHLRYCLTDVPPQPNSPPDCVFDLDLGFLQKPVNARRMGRMRYPPPLHRISKKTIEVVVFHCCRGSHLFYALYVFSQSRTRVKLNRVFFPR